MASFKAFNLSTELVTALTKMGYKSPSKVQSNVIPRALKGESMLAQSETGSGKTHAYLIPILERMDFSLPRVQAMVVAPTRELARQVYEFSREFCKYFPKFRVRLFTSEADRTQNEEGLSSADSPQLVVGTPGRLLDLLKTGSLNAKNCKTLVLDEADMLLDLGFFDDVASIVTGLGEPQILVFSATLKENLKTALGKFVKSTFSYDAEDKQTAGSVSHHLVDVRHADRVVSLLSLLKIKNPYLCIVFASNKTLVKEAYEGVKAAGYTCCMFSGDLEERERKKTIRLIRENRYQVIVASDLLARGIDIPDVSEVISLDLPSEIEYYFHRAGRTGRFGKSGDSFVFYDADTTARPKMLIDAGLPFNFLVLKNDKLTEDPVGLLPKRKLLKKKALPEEEIKELRLAKATTKTKKVKPSYKKKTKWAMNKVKQKYRRKAIQKSIRQDVERKYKAESKKGKSEDE